MTYSKEFEAALKLPLKKLGNRTAAIGAQSYMKDIAPFLGVKTPERRSLVKKIAKELKTPTSAELGQTARALWKLDEREYHYAAFDLIQIHIEVASKNFLAEHVEYLITHKSWWDTVDGLGSAAVSPLTDKYGCEKIIESWNKSENMWLNRSAILFQLGYKEKTNFDLLKEICEKHQNSKEFFIQKAIGWSLRQYARTDAPWVIDFVENHALAALSKREALLRV